MSKNDGAAVAGGCLGLLGLAALYIGFIAAIVWVIATIVHGVFS